MNEFELEKKHRGSRSKQTTTPKPYDIYLNEWNMLYEGVSLNMGSVKTSGALEDSRRGSNLSTAYC